VQRILPDTNVLLVIRELDLLMRCHAAEVLKVVWCDELLAEFERACLAAPCARTSCGFAPGTGPANSEKRRVSMRQFQSARHRKRAEFTLRTRPNRPFSQRSTDRAGGFKVRCPAARRPGKGTLPEGAETPTWAGPNPRPYAFIDQTT
jgi:hypothetical protein